MLEILLHYIWQKGLFLPYEQCTTDGQSVEVLCVGAHNRDSGPDFTNVRLRLGGVELAGNVEMHLNSSDWYRHRHHLDAAYDSILLHVVRRADKPVYNSKGQSIPQLELRYPNDRDYLQQLMDDASFMDSAVASHACAHHLLRQPSLMTEGWKRTMLIRRLDCKQRNIEQLLFYFNNDLAQAMYITLAHHFGFHVNGIPMEMMAMHTPLKILRKHMDNLLQLQALLLGQAGLLEGRKGREAERLRGAPLSWLEAEGRKGTPLSWLEAEEAERLRGEYAFLKYKYDLTPMDASLWKHNRLRPQNAPEVRVCQLAQLLYQSDFLFSRALEATNLSQMRALLAQPSMGQTSIDSLIINVILPYQYVSGQKQRVMELLEELSPENNAIIRQWQMLGQQVHSAADTQALIHLYQTCCQSGQCINCDVAYQIFLQAQ